MTTKVCHSAFAPLAINAPQDTRSAKENRLSASSLNPFSRHGSSRNHSHSISLGAANNTHRISRRKSMSANNPNVAALAAVAAVARGHEHPFAATNASHRRVILRRSVESSSVGAAGISGLSSFRTFAHASSKSPDNDAALADGPPLSPTKHQVDQSRRRASEGSHLLKTEGRRFVGSFMKCDKCGKGYKHASCLEKHLWEHTPQWQITSKLLISKHQQVQMLQAATTLEAMRLSGSPTSPDALEPIECDNSSPEASGSSEYQDEEDEEEDEDDNVSSTETTPPPDQDVPFYSPGFGSTFPTLYRHTSDTYSRPYPSGSSPSPFTDSVSNPLDFGHFQYMDMDESGEQQQLRHLQDQQDEAKSLGALGRFSFGSPDVPPVPRVPSHLLSQSARPLSQSPLAASLFPLSLVDFAPPVTHRISEVRDSDVRDVKTNHGDSARVTVHHKHRPVEHDDDDDLILGKMEE